MSLGSPVVPLPPGGIEWATKTVFSRRVTEAERHGGEPPHHYIGGPHLVYIARFQARSKDQEILEEGGGAGPSS